MPKARKDKNYDSPFAKNLRTLMDTETVTTQIALAKAIGVSRQTIAQYMDGSAQPLLDKFSSIAEYFNVSADYLLGKEEISTTDVTLKEFCKYTGVSVEAAERLASLRTWIKGNHCPLNPILEHEGLTEFLEAVRRYVWSFNLNHYSVLDNANSEAVEVLSNTFNCDESDLKEYIKMSSIAVIESALMKIVDSIGADEQIVSTRKSKKKAPAESKGEE